MSIKKINKSRRNFILASSGLVLFGGLVWLKPSNKGAGGHSAYFNLLESALKNAGIARPSLVIDKKKLHSNIAVIKDQLADRFGYRVVTKSLPSIKLLKAINQEANTSKLMLFHQPFLNAVADQLPESDVLMGKPMPIAAVKAFYSNLKSETEFNPERQLQWLLDQPARLSQYEQFARSENIQLNINIELNIGLHRGGVGSDQQLIEMLELIEQSPNLNLSGFMGYEPHIGKVPGSIVHHRNKAMDQYEHYLQIAETYLRRSVRDLCLNGAGSQTYQLYSKANNMKWPMNEISAGSCLLKPSDFDLDTLQNHQPAAFIATPVIKKLENTQVPGVEFLSGMMAQWDPNLEQTYFIYGGYWKALPVSPVGLKNNALYGRSSNQEMLNGSNKIQLQQDDLVFLRPTQSESVLLQFGDLLVYDNGRIDDRWPVMQAI